MIKKYNDQKNVAGKIIKEERQKRNMAKTELTRKLELLGIYIDRNEIYLLENNQLMIKDFELIAIAKVLNLDLNKFKDLLD